MGAGSGGKVRQLLPPGTRWPPAAPGTAPCTPAAGSSSPAPACGDGMGSEGAVFWGPRGGEGLRTSGLKPTGPSPPTASRSPAAAHPAPAPRWPGLSSRSSGLRGTELSARGHRGSGDGPHVIHPYLCPGVSWPLSAALAEPLYPAGPPRSSAAGRMPVETRCLLWGALAPRGAPNHPVPQTSHSTGHPCTSSLA